MSHVFREYKNSEREILVDVIRRFWDDLIAKDRYSMMQHPDEYGEVYTRELLAKLKNGEGALFWIMDGDTRMGFVAGAVEAQSESSRVEVGAHKIGRILEVFVEPTHRNKSLGTALIQEMERHLTSRGCTLLKIEVFALNAGAHRLYQRMGYADWTTDLFKRVGGKSKT